MFSVQCWGAPRGRLARRLGRLAAVETAHGGTRGASHCTGRESCQGRQAARKPCTHTSQRTQASTCTHACTPHFGSPPPCTPAARCCRAAATKLLPPPRHAAAVVALLAAHPTQPGQLSKQQQGAALTGSSAGRPLIQPGASLCRPMGLSGLRGCCTGVSWLRAAEVGTAGRQRRGHGDHSSRCRPPPQRPTTAARQAWSVLLRRVAVHHRQVGRQAALRVLRKALLAVGRVPLAAQLVHLLLQHVQLLPQPAGMGGRSGSQPG